MSVLRIVVAPLLVVALAVVSLDAALPDGTGGPGYDYCQAPYPSARDYTPLPNATLVHVQVLLRHGDRAPTTIVFPNEQANWVCDDALEMTQVLDANGRPQTGAYIARVVIPEKKPFPDSIWSSGSCLIGQLTGRGIRQHLQLGRQVRDIYVGKLGFLPSQLNEAFSKQQLYVRSSEAERTKKSGAAFLTGLWPISQRTPGARAIVIHT
ncbi:histidine phosphatase superfamily, partial [Thamnocephalis sphaerospora]